MLKISDCYLRAGECHSSRSPPTVTLNMVIKKKKWGRVLLEPQFSLRPLVRDPFQMRRKKGFPAALQTGEWGNKVERFTKSSVSQPHIRKFNNPEIKGA